MGTNNPTFRIGLFTKADKENAECIKCKTDGTGCNWKYLMQLLSNWANTYTPNFTKIPIFVKKI